MSRVVLALLALPRKAYAGYGFFATVAVEGAPDGTLVRVGRDSGTALGGKAEVVLSLKRGRHTLTPAVTIGAQTITGDAKPITVAKPGRWSTAQADGSYEGSSGVKSRSPARGGCCAACVRGCR